MIDGDLGNMKKRLAQEKYWSKNPGREGSVEYSFQDGFEEKEWVMWGARRGKTGELIPRNNWTG